MHPNDNITLNKLKGKKVLITAGPTYELIDPVRFIGNFSTGKMGYAIADAMFECGAEVILISGPTDISPKHALNRVVKVQSAREMYEACVSNFPYCEIAILSAAVADYRPVDIQDRKIKSDKTNLVLHLEKTEDIALELGRIKKPGQILIGFALETHNELVNAREKLKKKKFDLIVLNSLKDKGAGFGTDTNKITIIDADNKIHNFGLRLKEELANDIVRLISEKMK